MKIKWIEFENLETGLKIEHIDFLDDITLLVGLSGAGKSQILNAILYSMRLALGKTHILSPYKVDLGININNHEYKWSYTIQKHKKNDELLFKDTNEYYFAFESLLCDNKNVFTRNNDKIKMEAFDNIPTPKKNESLIYQYSEDSYFKEIVSGLRKMYPLDMNMDIRGRFESDEFIALKSHVDSIIKKNNQTDFIIFSHLPSLAKIYIARKHYPEQFVQILNDVQNIFPEIEDIDVIKDSTREYYCVEIIVYGKKLLQTDISNGMLKTIYYIVELYTASENSLIMIDEFENGLGMNCIDAISNLMLEEKSGLQYIITSHHPKIIGNIDYHCWRIIERNENIIKNYDCDDSGYDLGGNRHDAYFNLLNKWSYEGKI